MAMLQLANNSANAVVIGNVFLPAGLRRTFDEQQQAQHLITAERLRFAGRVGVAQRDPTEVPPETP